MSFKADIGTTAGRGGEFISKGQDFVTDLMLSLSASLLMQTIPSSLQRSATICDLAYYAALGKSSGI